MPVFLLKTAMQAYTVKKDEKNSKKHLTKEEVFGNIDEHC